MFENMGYIKLHRKIMETSFYTNINCCHLAIHLLLQANRKPNKILFNGKEIIINRGEYLTGLFKLSKETGLSMQNVRTCLANLHSIGFLTSKVTNKFTIFFIVNYDKYQNNDDKLTSELTNKQQTTNKPLTTNKNDNNDKNKDNIDMYADIPGIINNEIKKDTTNIIHNSNVKEKENNYNLIFEYWNSKKIKEHRTINDKIKSKINTILSEKYTIEEIKRAIDNYKIILTSEGYFHYIWDLWDFLGRGFHKYKELEIAKKNYKIYKKDNFPDNAIRAPEGKYDNVRVYGRKDGKNTIAEISGDS